MDNRGVLNLILLALVFLLIILGIGFGGVVFKGKSEQAIKDKSFGEDCIYDEDCGDDNGCTIDTCREGSCHNTNVILCYQDDGCCPNGCTTSNDNDCFE